MVLPYSGGLVLHLQDGLAWLWLLAILGLLTCGHQGSQGSQGERDIGAQFTSLPCFESVLSHCTEVEHYVFVQGVGVCVCVCVK